MSWKDRVRQVTYTSPSGAQITAPYELLDEEFDKQGSEFNFIGVKGTYVQDLGRSGRRYPFTFFVWGEDYDLEATRFMEVLAENGVGRLEHPLYGTISVVTTGRISRRDDLKNAGNQASIQVLFFETSDILFNLGEDRGRSLLTKINNYTEISSESFKQKFDLVSAIGSIGLKARFLRGLQLVRKFAQVAAAPRNEVLLEFNSIYNSISNSLDVLVTSFPTSGGFNPAQRAAAIENFKVLASQTVRLVQTPAKAALINSNGSLVPTDGRTQLEAYRNLVDAFTVGANAIQTPDTENIGANNFNVDDLFASAAVTGAALTVSIAQYITKPQSLEAANTVLEMMDDVTNWRDLNFESIGNLDFSQPQQDLGALKAVTDTGGIYQQLQTMVSLVAGFLVQISFNLKQERVIQLSRNRTIVDLAAELYGAVDSELDFLISSNNLTGDEILELPAGKQIVYYV